MASRSKRIEARFEQVLLYADGPQVILLSSPGQSKIVAIAINDAAYNTPFFAVQVSLDQFKDYLADRFDLRYLLLKPALKRFFIFDLASAKDDVVSMLPITPSKANDERYLPDHGIFARDHTEQIAVDLNGNSTEQVFGVDGSWELGEFSHFYSQITDLYVFFSGVDSYQSTSIAFDKKQQIRNAFSKPFEGGGSYVSLYDTLSAAQTRSNRLRVGGISYNSPGHIKIIGSAQSFAELRELINHLQHNYVKITDDYKSLRRTLSKNGLLKLAASKFDTRSKVAQEVEVQSEVLTKALNVVEYNTLLEMSGDNKLVAAKVLLSIYRRATRLYQFFQEGRASLDVPTSLG